MIMANKLRPNMTPSQIQEMEDTRTFWEVKKIPNQWLVNRDKLWMWDEAWKNKDIKSFLWSTFKGITWTMWSSSTLTCVPTR